MGADLQTLIGLAAYHNDPPHTRPPRRTPRPRALPLLARRAAPRARACATGSGLRLLELGDDPRGDDRVGYQTTGRGRQACRGTCRAASQSRRPPRPPGSRASRQGCPAARAARRLTHPRARDGHPAGANRYRRAPHDDSSGPAADDHPSDPTADDHSGAPASEYRPGTPTLDDHTGGRPDGDSSAQRRRYGRRQQRRPVRRRRRHLRAVDRNRVNATRVRVKAL